MPRLPIDYSKTLIYKLVHKEDYDNANIYIGSTTDFRKRKNRHKTSCCNEKNKEYNQKKYEYIRTNGGWENWNMIEIEKYPCNDKREAEKREEYHRAFFNANLNSKKAFITEEQYKEQRKEQRKEYYEQYNEQHKEQKKEYYEQHKEQMKEQMKEYYEQHKEQMKEKTTCICGCIILKRCLNRHYKSKKHTDFILINNQID